MSMCVCVSVRLEPVQQLVVDTESESSVRVRWRGVAGASVYRLVWGPFSGNGAKNPEKKNDMITTSGQTGAIATAVPDD